MELTDMDDADFPAAWQAALAHSRFLRQMLTARPDVVDWLREHDREPVSAERMQAFLDTETIGDEDGLKRALRRLRQRVMAALIVRDLGEQAPLDEVFETMTALADVTAALPGAAPNGAFRAALHRLADEPGGVR